MPRGRKPTTGNLKTRNDLETRAFDLEELGLSFDRIARACGVSQRTVINILQRRIKGEDQRRS